MELFYQTSIDKQLHIETEDGTVHITNEELYSEEFELEESVCSETQLVFGKCEASKLKFKIANSIDSLKEKWITVTTVLNGDESNTFQFGKYKVESDVPSGNRNYRTITAYDAIHSMSNKNVASWYNGLDFPVTMKEFRDSFFAYLGLTQVSIDLVNDSMIIEKTIETDTLSGGDVIKSICEINGVFGHVDRNGEFQYISLSSSVAETIDEDFYISSEYEDFTTKAVDTVQIRQEEGDIGVTVGTGTDIYVIEGNFLCYGKEIEELNVIGSNLLAKISEIQYVPLRLELPGLPHLQIGSYISVSTKNGTKNTYILERTLKGIQSLKDTFESKGTYERNVTRPSLETQIQQLKGKSNVLEKDIEHTRSEISDLEEETSTKIEQTADSLNVSIQALEESTKASSDATNEEIENIKKSLEVTVTSDDVKIQIEKELGNGAEKVVTSTGYTLNDEGLKVEKSDSEMATTITEDGMTVTRSGEQVLVANNKGVDAENLHATTYLIIGNTSRFEDYYNDDGELRTGCFWIGDIPYVESITAVYSGGDVTAGTSVSSLSGITVTATYSNGTTANVTDYTLSGTIVEGTNTITVNYSGKTTTFTVVGVAPEATISYITATYTGGSVVVGTALSSLTGITVKAVYSDGSTKTVTDYSLSGQIAEGENTITVTYSGFTTTFTVTGVAASISYIRATYTGGSVPVGTSLDELTGITVKAYYNDGTTATIVSGYTLSGTIAEGSNTIVVTYKTYQTDFTVVGVASGEDTTGYAMKTGTITDSSTIETGLSSIKQLILYRGTFTATGLMDLTYNEELGTAYSYCSSYASYIKSGGMSSSSTYLTIDGGTATWTATSSSYGMASGVEYTWIAFGEE